MECFPFSLWFSPHRYQHTYAYSTMKCWILLLRRKEWVGALNKIKIFFVVSFHRLHIANSSMRRARSPIQASLNRIQSSKEANTTELQKASNLPPNKIFKVCKPSSRCCKVGLSKRKIRMNLENESIFFQKEGMIFWNRSSIIFLLC